MSTSVDYTPNSACSTPGSVRKIACPQIGTGIHRGLSIDISAESTSDSGIRSQLNQDTCAIVLSHSDGDNFEVDVSAALYEIRRYEKDNRRPIFVILSLVHVVTKDAFLKVCKFIYSNGFDGILIKAPVVDAEASISFIRTEALGLRGRRVKIILDDVAPDFLISEVDGILTNTFTPKESISRVLAAQNLIFTFDPSLTDTLSVDLLLSPHVEPSTPATTVPSTPVISSTAPKLCSFLLREVEKAITGSTRLIVVLSDDGQSAMELSFQSRNRSLPPILALSAAESVCRFMGCLRGVTALQTPSFISVPSVVSNALDWAKSSGLVEPGDHVVIVLQPPPVTASTNAACYEGIVQSKYLE